MNIFFLHEKPNMAAFMHCDKHCVKMILETAQMLSTAHRVTLDGDPIDNPHADSLGLLKAAFVNHPSTVWVRTSSQHYRWAYHLFSELLLEYEQRYDRRHALCRLYMPLQEKPALVMDRGFVPPPQCMPAKYRRDPSIASTVKAYRDYILGEKMHFAKWDRGEKPYWVSNWEFDQFFAA